MRRLKDRKVESPSGIVTVQIFLDDYRKGTLSPQSIYYFYNNRFISRYERKVRKWSSPPLGLMFEVLYSQDNTVLHDLIFLENPFLSLIPKENTFMGGYMPLWRLTYE